MSAHDDRTLSGAGTTPASDAPLIPLHDAPVPVPGNYLAAEDAASGLHEREAASEHIPSHGTSLAPGGTLAEPYPTASAEHVEEDHPVTTGVGALSLGTSAAIAGATFGGPVGAVAAGVVGAVVGGIMGHDFGETAAHADDPVPDHAHARVEAPARE